MERKNVIVLASLLIVLVIAVTVFLTQGPQQASVNPTSSHKNSSQNYALGNLTVDSPCAFNPYRSMLKTGQPWNKCETLREGYYFSDFVPKDAESCDYYQGAGCSALPFQTKAECEAACMPDTYSNSCTKSKFFLFAGPPFGEESNAKARAYFMENELKIISEQGSKFHVDTLDYTQVSKWRKAVEDAGLGYTQEDTIGCDFIE